MFAIVICGMFLSVNSTIDCEQSSGISFGEEPTINGNTTQSDIYYQLLKAGYYSNMGKSTKAFNSFNNLFSMQPPVYVYEPYLKLLFETGDIKKVLAVYTEKTNDFETKFKKNLDFWTVIAQSLLITNQDDKAGKIFSDLIKDYPDNEQIAYYHTMSMLKSNRLEEALKYLDECLTKACFKQKYFLFYFLRSKIYLQQNKLELASKDIDKSLEQFPRFDRGWLIKAMLLEQQGKINEAIKGYMHFLNLVGRDEMIEKQIIQLLFNQKRYDEAAKYLKKLKGDTAEYYFNIALIEFNSGRMKQALKSVTTCIKKSPNIAPARLLKIDILISMHDFKSIIQVMEEWINQTPIDHTAVNTLLLLRKTPINPKNIIRILENAALKHKDDVGLLSAIADLYVEQRMFAKGLENYKKVHDITTNPELKSKVLFHMAYVYLANSQIDKAENILNTAVNLQPIYPQSLNMLAYIYANKSKDLNKALELIDKALESDKYSPFYLDTKGLIFLKMEKYNQALELFERASTISPSDKDIINHIIQTKSLIVSQIHSNLNNNNEK